MSIPRSSSQIEQAGFKLNLNCDEAAAQAIILIDADTFTQIIINLVDNAIKFAAKAERKEIDLSCHLQRDGTLMFAVRDYGPGVPKGPDEEDLQTLLSIGERADP